MIIHIAEFEFVLECKREGGGGGGGGSRLCKRLIWVCMAVRIYVKGVGIRK